MAKKLVAEFVGTFILVFIAVGAAVTGIGIASNAPAGPFAVPAVGPMGVALAFGFTLMALVYAIGAVSGCHVNPAVSLAMLVARKIDATTFGAYVVAQFLGAIAGAAVLKLFVSKFDVKDTTGALGTNSYGTNINMVGALVLEILLTLVFVFVILMVTDKFAVQSLAGVAIGAALIVVHLMGISLDGTSVNPARSFGPALMEGGTPLSQVWVFIVAPLIGGVLAALLWRVTRDTNLADDDEALADIPEER